MQSPSSSADVFRYVVVEDYGWDGEGILGVGDTPEDAIAIVDRVIAEGRKSVYCIRRWTSGPDSRVSHPDDWSMWFDPDGVPDPKNRPIRPTIAETIRANRSRKGTHGKKR